MLLVLWCDFKCLKNEIYSLTNADLIYDRTRRKGKERKKRKEKEKWPF